MVVVMNRIDQLLPFSFVIVVGLTFFTPVLEAKLGESHNDNRRLQRFDGNSSSRYPLDQCEGDCDVDRQCKGNLICFHREGSDSVPGCVGGNRDTTSTDYCIDPRDIISDNKMILPELKWLGRNPQAIHFPLRECEGDCDQNSDCATGLVCLQRRYENTGHVPGCWGRDNSLVDYCVKSSFEIPEPQPPPSPTSNQFRSSEFTAMISPPDNEVEIIEDFGLKMYWESHYMWQEENFDRRWCMECRDQKCDYGDKTYIHTCEQTISQRYDFVFVNDSGAMIRLHGTNLCFERINMDIFLYDCDLGNRRQLWIGDFRRDRFEIKPLGRGSDCVTQRHHPKFYEEVEIEKCQSARSSHTSYWTRY